MLCARNWAWVHHTSLECTGDYCCLWFIDDVSFFFGRLLYWCVLQKYIYFLNIKFGIFLIIKIGVFKTLVYTRWHSRERERHSLGSSHRASRLLRQRLFKLRVLGEFSLMADATRVQLGKTYTSIRD